MNRLHLLPALAAMLLWQAAPADEPVDAADPARLAELIRGLGYRAAVESDNLGDPMITSAAGGDTFVIYFFGCSNNRDCSALLFKIGFDLPTATGYEKVNDWNRSRLFGKAYADAEGDAWLEMPVNLHAGVTAANFADTYEWWEIAVAEFKRHIEF